MTSIFVRGGASNFVKVLIDGVPQTLPDGQSQLTNVDFGNIERAEVLRGASSSRPSRCASRSTATSWRAAGSPLWALPPTCWRGTPPTARA